jgi:DsbC/DsbD-like thiol-disulfide interchange protein
MAAGALIVFCGAMILTLRGANARAQTAQQNAMAVVKPAEFVSLDRVPRGREFQAAVVVQIAPGYHMNSHTPSEAYLIPTSLTAQAPAGFQVVDTLYPAGKQMKFSFSPDKPLDVYSGSVTLKMKLLAQNDAPLGAATIPVVLRYQACSDSTCLPPVKVPVDVKLEVSAAGSAAHPAHAEIFSAKTAK